EIFVYIRYIRNYQTDSYMKPVISKLLFTLIILILFYPPVFAQIKISGSVKGTITDSVTSQPLEFVSVAVKSLADSFVVQTTASDKTGKFLVKGIPAGSYELWLSFIGYQTRKIPFSITEQEKD